MKRLIVGTRFQGFSPRLLVEKLKVLEEKTKVRGSDWAAWANNGVVAELFGHAFVEADEVFSTGNFAKVMPITRIEGRDLQPGPICKKARELYWAYAHGET